MLEVCLLGCGGTMPTPERHLTALLTRYNGRSLLIDCGEGTQVAIRAQKRSFHSIDVICLTHFHADHVCGLPGLLLSMGLSGRTQPVHMIGPAGLEIVVSCLQVVAPHLPFPLIFHEMSAPEERFSIGGFEITAFSAEHSTPCYGYALRIPRSGRFLPERAREKGVPVAFWNQLQHGQAVGGFQPEDVLGSPRRGLSVVYCTDTRPIPALIQQARDADLLVGEGMYADGEKQEDAIAKKHMTFPEIAAIAAEAQPRELWLTHFSPSLEEPEEALCAVQTVFPNARVGENGLCADLNFDPE